MEDLKMRDRTPKPKTIPELANDDGLVGWILIAVGIVLIATSLTFESSVEELGPIPGAILVLAGLVLQRFFRKKERRRGSRSRRAVRRFIAVALVVSAVLALWLPVFDFGYEQLTR